MARVQILFWYCQYNLAKHIRMSDRSQRARAVRIDSSEATLQYMFPDAGVVAFCVTAYQMVCIKLHLQLESYVALINR